MLYMRIDQVMLGQMLGDREVGIFSAAVRISESWYFVPMAILSAMAPALIMTQSESHQLYEARLLRLARLLCWMAIIMALLLSICSRQIIVFLYGPSYAAASPVLAIHAWAGVFVALGVAAGPW